MKPHRNRRISAVALLACALAACHSNPPTGPHLGSVAGTVASSLSGPLANVSVTLTPATGPALPAVKTDTAGSFEIDNVPPGDGTIAIAPVPIGCTAPTTNYSGVVPGRFTVVGITVPCILPTGTIRGVVTNSLGGVIVEATVAVTPDTGAAPPAVSVSDTGAYVVAQVRLGTGKVTVASLPAGCTAPAAVPYASLGFGDTLTVNVAVSCTFLNQILFGALGGTRVYIAIRNPDGSGLRRVTPDTAEARTPAWAPDGQRFVFGLTTTTGIQLKMINADGTNEATLTDGTRDDQDPAWSPTGRQIAFTSDRPNGGCCQVWIMNSDGTNLTQLTNAWYAAGPSWSPDGTKIAYAAGYGSNLQHVWVMNADGSQPTQLTSEAGGDDFVAWSPDGSKIAFASGRDFVCSGCGQIYTMNADGSAQTRLTQNTDDLIRPEWSPDGTQIIYEDYTTAQLFIVNADGTNPTMISGGIDPAWKYRPTPALGSNRVRSRARVARRRSRRWR